MRARQCLNNYYLIWVKSQTPPGATSRLQPGILFPETETTGGDSQMAMLYTLRAPLCCRPLEHKNTTFFRVIFLHCRNIESRGYPWIPIPFVIADDPKLRDASAALLSLLFQFVVRWMCTTYCSVRAWRGCCLTRKGCYFHNAIISVMAVIPISLVVW